jgi:CrcB protein
MSIQMFIGVGLLGGCGALLRFLIDGEVSSRLAGVFPWGTLAVNLTGALLLGIIVGAGLSGDGLRLVALGLLGGFTTFSTWAFESHRLAESGLARLGLANFLVSLVFGVCAVWAGQQIGGLL